MGKKLMKKFNNERYQPAVFASGVIVVEGGQKKVTSINNVLQHSISFN